MVEISFKAGQKFVIKNSGMISKYHAFKEGETVELTRFIDMPANLADRITFPFKNDKGLIQDLFIRDVQPYKGTGE